MKVNLAQATVSRTNLNPNEDDAVFTSHWVADLGFAGSMTDTDRIAATTKIKTFWTAIANYVSNQAVLREVRWYELDDAAPHAAHFVTSKPITSGGAGGTGTACPPQVACSVTFKTAQRKNWGRFYVPSLTTTSLSTNGYFSTALVTAFANAGAALAGSATGPYLVVWSKTRSEAMRPSTVRVDDVPDVIRRRRFTTTTFRKDTDVS